MRSQQCQAELERLERQEEACITNRSAFNAEADNIHPNSSRIMRHNMEK
jgi:hypothetical protein